MSKQTHPLRRLLHYAGPHRRRLATAITYSILNKVFDLAPPLLIGAAVDVVVQQEDSILAGLGISSPEQQLILLAVATLVIWGLESVFEYAYAVMWRNLAQTLQHELRIDAYNHLQRLDLAYFEDRSSGELMAILNDDINQLERFLDGGANDLLQVGTTVVVIGAIFFSLAPGVAGYAFVPIPVILWGSFLFQKKLTPRYAAVRERVASLNSLLSNNLGGIATIKSFTSEAFESKQVSEESQRYQESNRRAIQFSSAFSPLIRMAIVVGFVLTLVLGGKSVFAGELGVGAYSVMVFMTQRLLWPLTRLGTTVDLYQRAMASTTRVLDLLGVPFHVREGSVPLPLNQVQGEIRFENVHFGYKPNFPVLNGLNLVARAKETIGIVGATGSGKSTLVKLILRFYNTQSGKILIDDKPIQDVLLSDLRKAVGFVSQDVFLFHGTVHDNIVYGSFNASRDEVIAAAKAAEAHDFILSLPEGYDTVVGERGQKLSGGQRQRVSIARAVLKNPPILVLDEATSAVDNETEAAIQRSLGHIAKDRTTIMIAHRLSTLRNAHAIYVMDAGRVVEQGTHNELVQANGLYAALWRVQTGEPLATTP